ncbi:hypothetical protein [Roseibium algae]|uniref:Cytochrome c domain-containing protein n=1 Tax=Roseibium algae TaxID=3123038 RepID=A0ABU8TJ31_9HYPH
MLWKHTSSRQPSVKTMPAMRVSLGLSALAVLSLMATTASSEPLNQLEQRGLELSKLHCARCHIVSEKDRFTGTSASPSFKIMIVALKDWDDRFDSFMARNPHPAHIRLEDDEPRPEHLPSTIHEVILSQDDIEAIISYVDRMAADLGHPRSE